MVPGLETLCVLWTSIGAIGKDQAAASCILYQHAQGMPPQKRRRRDSVNLQKRLKALCRQTRSASFCALRVPLASPAMGHWGTCPPRLSASYFKRTNTENVQKQRDFCTIFINFWPIFVIFFAHSFPQGVIIANKFQLNTCFRFR